MSFLKKLQKPQMISVTLTYEIWNNEDYYNWYKPENGLLWHFQYSFKLFRRYQLNKLTDLKQISFKIKKMETFPKNLIKENTKLWLMSLSMSH